MTSAETLVGQEVLCPSCETQQTVTRDGMAQGLLDPTTSVRVLTLACRHRYVWAVGR